LAAWIGEPGADMEARKPTLLRAVLVAILVVLLVVWGMVALSVDDALWFLPVFSADASYIDLYWHGEHVLLEPGSSGYALLNEALKEVLVHVRANPATTGLSDATLENLRATGALLEAHYAEPVRVHSWYLFGPSQVFYIPLSGYHASYSRVFNAGRGAPLQLRDIDAIMAAAEAIAQQEGLGEP
jgi:hypothetical protein